MEGIKNNQYSRRGLTVKYKKIYHAWYSMLGRCYKPNQENYSRYGANGITVCDEWRNSFETFLEWALSNGYEDGLQLDRIDFTKNYSPDNCRWVNKYVQAQNKGMLKSNRSGYKGVVYDSERRYRVYIMRNGKKVYVGFFTNLDAAIAARKAKEREYELTGTI